MVGVEGGGEGEEGRGGEEGCSVASLNPIKNESTPACGPLGFEFDCCVLRLRASKWTAPLVAWVLPDQYYLALPGVLPGLVLPGVTRALPGLLFWDVFFCGPKIPASLKLKLLTTLFFT